MQDFKNFFQKYSGAIIGAVVAFLILCTQLYKVIIGIILIAIGIYVGNYIQVNKYDVKEKLKNFIDRL